MNLHACVSGAEKFVETPNRVVPVIVDGLRKHRSAQFTVHSTHRFLEATCCLYVRRERCFLRLQHRNQSARVANTWRQKDRFSRGLSL